MISYHDKEWGVPVHDDRELFEFLILEGAQAGLSWATILARREGYRRVFANFDVQKVANFSETDFERITQDPGVIRNKLKVKSAINNSKRFIDIQKEFGSFNNYLWSFTDHKAIHNSFNSVSELPTQTELSILISKDMKKRKFTFVGPTICYAYIQSIGIVNDHIIHCFRYTEIKNL